MQANTNTSRAPTSKLSGDFWKYWAGQTISQLGSSVTLFALPLLVYKLTGSPLNLGISTAANFLPYLLFGLVLGAWTDRVNRKLMMIGVDIARALIIATLPLLAILGFLPVWWIYVVGFIHLTLTICFEAGEFAALPSLVNLVYGVIGVLTFLIPFAFSFTALGHAERYIPEEREKQEKEPVKRESYSGGSSL